MRRGKRRCYARGKFSANISAHRAPGIGEVIRIPVGSRTYTFAALATARLPAEVYLLAIGNLIVHLLTVSFPYVSPSCHTGAAYIDKERGDVSGSFIIPYVPKNFMINTHL